MIEVRKVLLCSLGAWKPETRRRLAMPRTLGITLARLEAKLGARVQLVSKQNGWSNGSEASASFWDGSRSSSNRGGADQDIDRQS